MSLYSANITTSPTLAYPSVGNTAITFFTLCNYTPSTDASVNVYLVPNGGSAANTNIILSNVVLTGGETYQLYAAAEKVLLGNGDTIYVTANTNSAVTTTASYTTI